MPSISKKTMSIDFDFWQRLARVLWPRVISRLPLRRLIFRLRVIPVDPCLIARDDLPHNIFIWHRFLQHVCCHRQVPFLLFGGENYKALVHDSLQPKLTKDWEVCWDQSLVLGREGVQGHNPANRGAPKCTHSRVKKSVTELFDQNFYTRFWWEKLMVEIHLEVTGVDGMGIM